MTKSNDTLNSVIVKDNMILLTIDFNDYNIAESHPNFDAIFELVSWPLQEIDWDDVLSLVDIPSSVKKTLEAHNVGTVTLEDGEIVLEGATLRGAMVDRIIEIAAKGFDVKHLLKFVENIHMNPSKTSIDELYLFLEECNLPITTDGHFLAYKVVRSNFYDKHSGTMDNSVGNVVSMPRNQVDDNRDRTCSSGLHFCSKKYLKSFHYGDDVIVVLKIHPKDVVSIPSDYNNSKGRCCEYEVVGIHKGGIEDDIADVPVVDEYDNKEKQPRDKHGRFLSWKS